jgi:hypothetical protein
VQLFREITCLLLNLNILFYVQKRLYLDPVIKQMNWPSQTISLKSVIMVFSHLFICLPNTLSLSVFSFHFKQKACVHLTSPIFPTHLIFLCLITLVSDEEYSMFQEFEGTIN